MKFIVSRTSVYDDEISPAEGAIKEKCLRVDARTFKSPEEYDKRFPENPWKSKGINHRKDGTGIARDFEHQEWFIEIQTLDDLLTFAKKHGDIVVSAEGWRAKGFPSWKFTMIIVSDSFALTHPHATAGGKGNRAMIDGW